MLELRIFESEQGGALGIQDGWMAMAPDRQRPVFLANKLCNRVWKRSRCPSSYAEGCSSIERGARSTIPLCRNRPVFATPYVCRSGSRRRKETVFPGPDRMMVTSISPDYRIRKDVNKPRTGASWIRSRKGTLASASLLEGVGKGSKYYHSLCPRCPHSPCCRRCLCHRARSAAASMSRLRAIHVSFLCRS